MTLIPTKMEQALKGGLTESLWGEGRKEKVLCQAENKARLEEFRDRRELRCVLVCGHSCRPRCWQLVVLVAEAQLTKPVQNEKK